MKIKWLQYLILCGDCVSFEYIQIV